MHLDYNGLRIEKICHACFRISSGRTVYIDPFRLPDGSKKADIIFITHEHFDHLSIEDLEKIITKETVIVCSKHCEEVVRKLDVKEIFILLPGWKKEIKGIKVTAVPAYNINKFRSPGMPFHPKERMNTGFVIDFGIAQIYHMGDTDNIPELSEVKNIDILLVPVSGTYVMTADEAAEASNVLQPRKAIPMHYGAIVGTEADALRFKSLARCETVILD